MHESVEPGLLPDFCNVSDRAREIFFLSLPLPNLIPKHFVFTQNLPKAVLMPINKRYLSHSNYHLRVRPNLDSLLPERILNSFTGLVEC